jgi:hypothetical protein
VIGISATIQETAGMRRQVIAFVGASIVWVLVASVLDRLLRVGLPGYALAEPAMTFTLSMQWGRLALGALASLSAGLTLARVAPNARRLPLICGSLLLAAFLPVHYNLWNKFPIWYHLVFLLTIIPLVMLGARIGAKKVAVTES